jgi:hypothetical protein
LLQSLAGAILCEPLGLHGGGVETTMDFVMRTGPYQGRDPRTLCREAIAFWKDYLDAIERGVQKMRKTP